MGQFDGAATEPKADPLGLDGDVVEVASGDVGEQVGGVATAFEMVLDTPR